MHLDAAAESRLAVLRTAPLDRWIALSADESRLIAAADTFEEIVIAVEKSGEADPVILRVPPDWELRVA
jgi:hypothetical protein